ncbi:MAG: TolC family protein [Cyclobacteriaceae bacterium]
MRTLFVILIFTVAAGIVVAQPVTADEAVAIALKNNPSVQAAELFVREAKALRATASEMGKFSVLWMSGEYNSVNKDNNITISQTLPLPTTMAAQARLARENFVGAGKSLDVVRNELAYEVRLAFDDLLYLQALKRLLQRQDSILTASAQATASRFRAGEATLLEKITAETQSMEAHNQLMQQESDIRIQELRLRKLLFIEEQRPMSGQFEKLPLPAQLDTAVADQHPAVGLMRQQAIIGQQYSRLQRNLLMPDVTVGYFNQSLIGFQNLKGQDVFFDKDKRFTGIQLGLSVPLWAGPQLARSRAANLNAQALERKALQTSNEFKNRYQESLQELEKANSSLRYYESSAIAQAELIIRQAQLAFKQGELGFNDYLLALRSALQIQTSYLNALNSYNKTILKIHYLNGQN